MIWRPKPGQRVEVRYNKRVRRFCLSHGAHGTVRAAGCGPGPINALIELDDGARVIVPRGNLLPEAT